MKRLIVCGWMLLVSIACSNPTGIGPSPVPSKGGGMMRGVSEVGQALNIPPDPSSGNSCPHDAPSQIVAGTFGLRVDVEWSHITSIHAYEVSIDRWHYTNEWQSETVFVVEHITRAEWYGTQGSRYRIRVRSRTCGDEPYGQWSQYAFASINGEESPTRPVPPAPPPDDDLPPPHVPCLHDCEPPPPPPPPPDPDVTFCHVANNTTMQAHGNELAGHLGHGDYLGECTPPVDPPPDDDDDENDDDDEDDDEDDEDNNDDDNGDDDEDNGDDEDDDGDNGDDDEDDEQS